MLWLSDSLRTSLLIFFFFNDTATTEIYTLSLHDALPISLPTFPPRKKPCRQAWHAGPEAAFLRGIDRSEEHTSELQSQSNLVCRLLLEKKKRKFSGTNPVELRGEPATGKHEEFTSMTQMR